MRVNKIIRLREIFKRRLNVIALCAASTINVAGSIEKKLLVISVI